MNYLKLIPLLALTAASNACAEVPSYVLPDVVVYANAQANIDNNVDVKKISIGAAKTVPELLRTTAGLQIQTRPNSGGNEDLTVKLRGHDSRHYTVLVDGVPQAMAGVMGGSYVNWNAIPLAMVERIEITKGAKSAAHGQTEGGVINIITKKDVAAGGELQITAGSNDRRQYSLNYSANSNKLGFSVYAAKTEEDAYLRNADYDNEQLGLHINYAITATDKLLLNFDHLQLKRGLVVENIPGTTNYNPAYPTTPDADGFASNKKTPGDGSYTKLYRNNFNIGWSSTGDKSTSSLTYWRNNEKQREVNIDAASKKLFFDRYNITDKSSGLVYNGSIILDEHHTLGYGADYKRLRYGYGWYNAGNGSSLYPSQKLDLYGLYAEDNWKMDDRWTTNIGLRFDKMKGNKDDSRATNIDSMSESALSPKLNVHLKADAKNDANFSINRIWRAPSMAEFYWHYNGFGFATNQNLPIEPEKGWGYEIAINHRFNDDISTKLSGFYQNIDDYLNFTHRYPYNCYNIDKAKLWGYELENNWQLNNNSALFLNYTNLHTKKEGTNPADNIGLHDELDYRPRHTVALGYQYDQDKWHARYDMTYISSQKATLVSPSGNSPKYQVQEIGGYVVHNLSATYDFTKDTSLNMALYNIFDKEYCEIYGYPMEGRVFTATLTQHF